MHADSSLPRELLTALERLPPPDHVCALYDEPELQFATSVAFIRIGLERGERCLYVAHDKGPAMTSTLRAAGVDVAAAIQAGSLSILQAPEPFLTDGYLDPDRICNWFVGLSRAATDAGFAGFRVVGEMTWALERYPGVEVMAEFESKFNDVLRAEAVVGLCQYHRERFSAELIRSIIATHPKVVVGATVCLNPYYVPPQTYLSPDWPQREVEWLVENLLQLQRAQDALVGSEERHRNLSRYLFTVQERERRSLARELHDQIGQNLLALRMGINALSRGAVGPSVGASAARAEGVAALVALLDGTIEKVRTLAFELRPATLDYLGLVAALRALVADHGQRSGSRVHFSVGRTDVRAPAEVETACFRIVQEALANVSRHAQAQNVEVTLEVDEHFLRATVHDDGVGFDVEEVRSRSAQGADVGLVGMEERAALIGGNLEIRSSPGRGTTISAVFPLRQ